MSCTQPSISYWRRRRAPAPLVEACASSGCWCGASTANAAPAAWSVVLEHDLASTRCSFMPQPTQVIVVYEEARCDRLRIESVIYDEGYDVIPTRGAAGC